MRLIYTFILPLLIPFYGEQSSQENKLLIRAQLGALVKQVGRRAKDPKFFTTKELDKIRSDYNELADGINLIYQDAAKKISNGYLTRGKQIAKKHKEIRDGINKYEKDALVFDARIRKLIDSKLEVPENTNVLSDATLTGLLVVTAAVVDQVEDKLKKAACLKGAEFYHEVKWNSYEELTTEKIKKIDYSFLGSRCTEAIKNKYN